MAGVFTRKKFTVIILRKKCLYKIRWLISPISCCTSLAFCDTLLGWWMNGKFSFLNKVAFKVVCKGVRCLYNGRNSTRLLAYRYRITTFDISRESALNEGYIELITWRKNALVQYNSRCEFIPIDSVMSECDMYFSEEKRDFSDCECFALCALFMITTCKQVVIIKRIKQTNKKTRAINFLKKKSNFDHETGR